MSASARVFQRFQDQETSRRVARRFVRAMGWSEALRVLDFKSTDSPSAAEIQARYREKVKQVLKEKGALGVESTKDLNIAKTTLLGQFGEWVPENAEGERDPSELNRGPRRRGPPPPRDPFHREPPGGWKTEDKTKKEPEEPAPVPEGTTFEGMLSGLGSVEWKILTDGAYKTDVVVEQEEPRKTYFAYTAEYILVGRNSSHYVFAKVTRRENSRQGMGFHRSEPVYRWNAFKTEFPLSGNLTKIAPKTIKSLREGAHRQAKYRIIEGTVTEAMLKDFRGTLNLLDAINGSGLLAEGGDDSALKNRKLQIEIEPVLNREKYKAWKATPPPHYNGDSWVAYDWFIYVNGKKHQLSDSEVEELNKNHFLFAVYEYEFDKGKKNLTRMRGGRMFKLPAADVLKRLADTLNEGPLRDAVMAAADAAAAK